MFWPPIRTLRPKTVIAPVVGFEEKGGSLIPRIYFNQFWTGFLECTYTITVNFFINLFKNVFKTDIIIEHNITNANILCEHVCPPNKTLINSKQWKYSILVTGESVVSDAMHEHYKLFSCFLSGTTPNCLLKRIKFPLCTSYFYCNSHLIMPPVSTMPTKIVCAVITNPKGIVRNKFLNTLEKHIPVCYGGTFRNNIGYKIRGDHNSNNLLNFMRQFKFVIAMENNEEDYYITEKICNVLFAGVIPIYWGSPNVTQYFNEDRFLHLKNDSETEIDYIINKMINMDSTTYNRIVNSHILVNTEFIEPIATEMKQILIGL